MSFMSVKEAVKGALQGVLKGELQGAIRETIRGTNHKKTSNCYLKTISRSP